MIATEAYRPDAIDLQSSRLAQYLQHIRIVRESGTGIVGQHPQYLYLFPNGIYKDWTSTTARTRQRLELFEKIYRKVPMAGSAVDVLVAYVLQAGFRITGKPDHIKKIQDWIRYMDVMLPDGFYGHLEGVLRCMIIFGDAFVEVVTPKEPMPASRGGRREIFRILDMKILHPKTMEVERSKTGDVQRYVQKPMSHRKEPIDDEIPFKPDRMIHYRFRPVADSDYGTSAYERARSAIERKLGYEDDAALIVRRYASPITHYRLGTEQVPATQDQIDDFKNTLVELRPGDDIITSTAVSIDLVGARQAVMDVVPFQAHTDRNLMIGLLVPEVLMGQGQDRTQATAEIEMQSFVYTVKSLQRLLKAKIEGEIFTRLLRRSKKAMDRETVTDLPEIEWNIVETERDRFQRIGLLYKQDVIKLNEARLMAGMDEVSDGDIFYSEVLHKQALELEKQKAKSQVQLTPAGTAKPKKSPTDKGTPAAMQGKPKGK